MWATLTRGQRIFATLLIYGTALMGLWAAQLLAFDNAVWRGFVIALFFAAAVGFWFTPLWRRVRQPDE